MSALPVNEARGGRAVTGQPIQNFAGINALGQSQKRPIAGLHGGTLPGNAETSASTENFAA